MTPPNDPYNPSLELAAEIRKMIPRLPKHSPLRDLAQALLDGNAPPLHSKLQLISWLENPPPDSYGPLTKVGYWREKVVAAWILGQHPLSDEQIPQYGLALCQGLNSNSSFDQGILRLCLTSSILLPAIAVVSKWITLDPTGGEEPY